jgi:hypothetical protein
LVRRADDEALEMASVMIGHVLCRWLFWLCCGWGCRRWPAPLIY